MKNSDITVGRSTADAEFIGRGSPLGNPFRMNAEEERDLVCDLYVVWFAHAVKTQRQYVMLELRRLAEIASVRPLVLGCFCAPKRCHGDTIKEFLTAMLQEKPDDEL